MVRARLDRRPYQHLFASAGLSPPALSSVCPSRWPLNTAYLPALQYAANCNYFPRGVLSLRYIVVEMLFFVRCLIYCMFYTSNCAEYLPKGSFRLHLIARSVISSELIGRPTHETHLGGSLHHARLLRGILHMRRSKPPRRRAMQASSARLFFRCAVSIFFDGGRHRSQAKFSLHIFQIF